MKYNIYIDDDYISLDNKNNSITLIFNHCCYYCNQEGTQYHIHNPGLEEKDEESKELTILVSGLICLD